MSAMIKPHSDAQVGFYNVAAGHTLSPEMRDAVVKLCTQQMTIPPQTDRTLSEDWFSRRGLRFRIKPPLRILLERRSRGPVFGC